MNHPSGSRGGGRGLRRKWWAQGSLPQRSLLWAASEHVPNEPVLQDVSLEVAGKMRSPPSWMETGRDGELHGQKGRDGVCHTVLLFPLLSSCSSPLSLCSCSKRPEGLKEGETMRLHVDLLAGAGHVTTNSYELVFHFPKSFGQGRLLPVSDLPSGF